MSLRQHMFLRSDSHRLAAGLVLAAVGVLVVAVSFAAGRAGVAGADVLMWTGRTLVWIPLMLLAVAPGVPDGHRIAALVAQAVAQSLMRWMYAPRDFRFPDELLHLRTALEVSDLNTLAVNNPVLPIGPAFPGLQAVIDALASIGNMSIFAAGTVVVSAAHVSLALAVFGLVRLLGFGGRLAAAATVIFAIGPHHPAFNTMFIYLAPALLLMMTALVLALDVREARRLTGGLSVACLAGVIVTHHVTAAVVLIVLALGAGVAFVTGDRNWRRLALLTAAGTVLTVAWMAWRAPDIVTYLGGPIREAFGTSGAAPTGETTLRTPAPGLPARALAYAAFAAASVLVATGGLQLWRSARTPARLAAAGATGFYVVLGVRVLTGDGELAARGFTYTLLFAAIAVAVVVMRVWEPGAPLWRATASALVLTLLFAGFATVGWPPTWESVPGRFRIAGFESGVDRANTAAARWARTGIGPGRSTACDLGTCSLLGAYGRQKALSDASPLFYASTFGPETQRYVRDRALDFAVVDVRLSRQLPITGEYFRNDIRARRQDRPISRSALVKFDRAPQVSRVYDNGTVRIYDLRPEDQRRAP